MATDYQKANYRHHSHSTDQIFTGDGDPLGDVGAPVVFSIPFLIDGGGSAITTGIKGDIPIPMDCTITGWVLLADQTGSIVIDLWKDTYANFPPVVGDSITASAKPTLSSAAKGTGVTTTWTGAGAVTAGDIVRVNVSSITTVTRVTLSLTVTRA